MKKIILLIAIIGGLIPTGISQETIPMVVKINYSCLDFETINDKEQQVVSFVDLLNERGLKEFSTLEDSYAEIGQFKMYKVFPFLTTNDTVSITRTGERISIPPFWAVFQMQVPKNVNYTRLMVDLDKQTKLIDYAHPEYQAQPTSVPNDSLYNRQESLNGSIVGADINIEEAWDMETGEPFIKVGVHDNGIDTIHPDLNVLFGGAYSSYDYPESGWGGFATHGTPVAGIIGARRNDSTGIAGVAGGDGTDSSGVSLIDIKYSFGQGVAASYFMAGVVDAARSVGSYWNYPGFGSIASNYYNVAPGFGVHIGNHSYVIRTELPAIVGDNIGDTGNQTVVADCEICREAFLFSLRSGVINVVGRGNQVLNLLQIHNSLKIFFQHRFLMDGLFLLELLVTMEQQFNKV